MLLLNKESASLKEHRRKIFICEIFSIFLYRCEIFSLPYICEFCFINDKIQEEVLALYEISHLEQTAFTSSLPI
jgi:hypothetical protein